MTLAVTVGEPATAIGPEAILVTSGTPAVVGVTTCPMGNDLVGRSLLTVRHWLSGVARWMRR